jgi:hypothetical protein
MFKYIPQEIVDQACAVNAPDDIPLETFYHGDNEVWVLKNVWKNLELLKKLSYEFPVIAPTGQITAANPFFKQPVPHEFFANFTRSLYHVLYRYGKIDAKDIRIHKTWANIYQHKKIRVSANTVYPHTDDNFASGLVANFWLHPEDKDQATAFWRMKKSGSVTNNEDFEESRSKYFEDNPNSTEYFNFKGDKYIEKVLEIPATYGDVTLYDSRQIHSAVVSYDTSVIRHSWCLFMLIDL